VKTTEEHNFIFSGLFFLLFLKFLVEQFLSKDSGIIFIFF